MASHCPASKRSTWPKSAARPSQPTAVHLANRRCEAMRTKLPSPLARTRVVSSTAGLKITQSMTAPCFSALPPCSWRARRRSVACFRSPARSACFPPWGGWGPAALWSTPLQSTLPHGRIPCPPSFAQTPLVPHSSPVSAPSPALSGAAAPCKLLRKAGLPAPPFAKPLQAQPPIAAGEASTLDWGMGGSVLRLG